MKLTSFVFSFLLFQLPYLGNSQKNITIEDKIIYKRVEINYTNEDTFSQIAKLGIDLLCGLQVSRDDRGYKKIILEVSAREYKMLLMEGFNPIILIDDLSAYYAKRNMQTLLDAKKQLEKMKSEIRQN